jgi:hypothetical protein
MFVFVFVWCSISVLSPLNAQQENNSSISDFPISHSIITADDITEFGLWYEKYRDRFSSNVIIYNRIGKTGSNSFTEYLKCQLGRPPMSFPPPDWHITPNTEIHWRKRIGPWLVRF